MRSLVSAIFSISLFGFAAASWAGPERGRQVLDAPRAEDAAWPVVQANTDVKVDELLAIPSYTQIPAAEPDLSSSENPMIPLPPAAIMGLLMLGGIAVRVIKPQRANRLR